MGVNAGTGQKFASVHVGERVLDYYIRGLPLSQGVHSTDALQLYGLRTYRYFSMKESVS